MLINNRQPIVRHNIWIHGEILFFVWLLWIYIIHASTLRSCKHEVCEGASLLYFYSGHAHRNISLFYQSLSLKGKPLNPWALYRVLKKKHDYCTFMPCAICIVSAKA